MANIILFTDRTPLTQEINGASYQFERYSRPAGAYKLASVLRQNGYTVIVVPNSLRLSFHAIKEFIDANSTDLLWIGISTTFFTVKSDSIDEYKKLWATTTDSIIDLSILHNSHYMKLNALTQLAWGSTELNLIADFISTKHNAKLVLGGTWVSHIKDGSLDIQKTNVHIVTSMAEDYVVELTHALKLKQPIPFQLSSKEGMTDFKASTIDYTQSDFINKDDWLTLEVSRGCSFKCAYCTYDFKGKSDTTKYTKTLREELIRNYEQWGVTKYHLLDDLYNDSDYKIKLLYDEVWSKLPFEPEWVSYLRLDLIWSNPESAKWIEASGCKLGSFGIETLHDQAGKKVGKGLGKERILETLAMLKETWSDRVLVNALMIAGLPYEPYEHIVETIEWLQQTDLVDSYHYQALWVTPPEHKSFVLKQNAISENYEKYQLNWGPDGWINNAGVSFKMASELVANCMNNRYNEFFPIDLQEYPELRTAGYSHNELATKEFNPKIIENIKNQKHGINDLISMRLTQILKTTD